MMKIQNTSKAQPLKLAYDGREKLVRPGEIVSMDFYSTDTQVQKALVFRFQQKHGNVAVVADEKKAPEEKVPEKKATK